MIPLHKPVDDPLDLVRYPVRGRGSSKLVIPFASRLPMDGPDKTKCFPPISACNQKVAKVKTHKVAKLFLFIGNKSRRSAAAMAYRYKRKEFNPEERIDRVGPSGLRAKAKAKSAAYKASYPWRHQRR